MPSVAAIPRRGSTVASCSGKRKALTRDRSKSDGDLLRSDVACYMLRTIRDSASLNSYAPTQGRRRKASRRVGGTSQTPVLQFSGLFSHRPTNLSAHRNAIVEQCEPPLAAFTSSAL